MEIRWLYAFIDRPASAYSTACDFWAEATGTRLSPFRGEHDQFTTLLPPHGDAHLKVQALQAAGDVGGVHMDLSMDDVEAATTTAVDLGSSVTYAEPGFSVLRSPGGFQYCLVEWEGESERAAVFVAPDGSRSRLDQVCLDVAPELLDREVEFWHAMTGWPPRQGSLPEFQVLKPPGNLPIRILIQRLGGNEPALQRQPPPQPPPVTAHVDLACGTDIDAVAARHETLGATIVARRGHWTVMRDPAGSTYCLTARDPETGALH
jgi:Glyoxalase-like domain